MVFHSLRLTHSPRAVEMYKLHLETFFLLPTVALRTLHVVTQKYASSQVHPDNKLQMHLRSLKTDFFVSLQVDHVFYCPQLSS